MATIRMLPLHRAQQEIADTRGRFAVVACGRRFGKTILGEHLMTRPLLAGQPVAWVSPTYKMLTEVWRDFCQTYQVVTVTRNEQEHTLRLLTGGVLTCWSLESIESMRGQHYALVEIDEAAMDPDILDKFERVIRPTLIDLRGACVFFSTPRGRNGFHKLYLRGMDPGQPDWTAHHYTSFDNDLLDRGELDALADSMTAEAYRQEIMAEFLEDAGSVFRGLKTATMAPTGQGPDDHQGHIMVAGVDWGRQDDFTAVSIGCATCRREVLLDRFNHIGWDIQRGRVLAAFSRWHPASSQIELNSIGSPNFDALLKEGGDLMRGAVGFDTTPTSKGPLIEGLALELERGGLLLLPDPAGTAELEAYESKITKTGHIQYSAPVGMHDDTVMARALMHRAMGMAPRVRRITNRRSPMEDLLR